MTTNENPIDHLTEVVRRWADIPPEPEIRIGDPDRFLAYVQQAGIHLYEREQAGPDSIYGVPIRIDRSVPPDVMVFGDKVVRYPDPETGRDGWILDMSTMDDAMSAMPPSLRPTHEEFMQGWHGL